jgi:hypothetical protein
MNTNLLRRVFGTTAIASACLLVGCAAHPMTTADTTSVAPVVTAAVAEPTTKPAVVNPIFASDTVPTTQASPKDAQQLPAGHPALPSAAPSGALPAGHPAIGSAAGPAPSGPLPAGHPAINPTAAPAQQNGSLPPGHPSINGVGPTAPASTQPVIAGTLNIHAIQNTAGAAAIGAEPVSIDLVSNTGQVVSHSDTHLNADGTLELKGFDVRGGVQPIVTITHSGIAFSSGGEPMDADHLTQKVDVPIYETTEQAPAWSITMRHVIVQPSPAGLDVMEMFSVQSKGDRAWIGKADAKGQRSTFTVALPAGLQDLKIGGSLDSNTVAVADGKLISRQPMVPGDDRYEIEYTIPARDNKAVLSVTAPAAVGNMLVLVPDDGTTVDAAGMQSMGTQQLDPQGPKTRCFMASTLTEGQTVTLTIGSLKSAVAATRPTAAADVSAPAEPAVAVAQSSMMSKAIAVGGAVTILLIGTLITLLKSPKSARAEKNA